MNGGIKLAVEMMPSLAPSTAALIHPMRPTRWCSECLRRRLILSAQPVTLDFSVILYALHLIDTDVYQSPDSMSTIRNFQRAIGIAILTSLGMTSCPASCIAC